MKFENLIEWHCHILPAIDDGAQDMETSLKMIERLQQQGVSTVVLTPHYYSDTISLEDFLQKRGQAFEALQRALPAGSPALLPAAEVYISDYLFNNDSLRALCIGNTDYVLIEHPFNCGFGEATYNRLMNLCCDFSIRPILAHIERYKALMDDDYLLQEYRQAGCLMQVNISSFAHAPRSTRKKLLKYLDAGFIDCIGSDCHNLDSRSPDYQAGMQVIIKKCGQSAVDTLLQKANSLLHG